MDANLAIEYISVDEIKPYTGNARKHGEKDISAIVTSIEQFGFDDPIGIWSDENIIVEGHGRLEAAKKLGMKEVPCIRLDHLDDEQRRAYSLAHNRTAELSEWDFGQLEAELSDIDIEMQGYGFDEIDFPDIVDEEMQEDDDENGDKGSMKEKYLVPPFSLIYGNKPDWLARKRAWVKFGIRSEIGRGGASRVSISRLDGPTGIG